MPDGRLAILDFGSVKVFSTSFVDACRDYFRRSLGGELVDPLPAVKAAGFRIELEDGAARALLREVQEIASRPVRSADYDYGLDTASRELRGLKLRHARDVLRIRPPAEGVMFARAIAGCALNLRALGARGDFRAVFSGLLKVIP